MRNVPDHSMREVWIVLSVIVLVLIGVKSGHCAEPIEIVLSSSMGFPCDGLATPPQFGCIESQNGWIVVVKGDAKMYTGTLKYCDKDGVEKKMVVTAEPVEVNNAGETQLLTSLAFRVGRFLPRADFLGVEVMALRPAERIAQQADGAIITAGPTTWGPPEAAGGVLELILQSMGSRLTGLPDKSSSKTRKE